MCSVTASPAEQPYRSSRLPFRMRARLRFRRLWREINAALWKARYRLPSCELSSFVPVQTSILAPIMDQICLPPFAGPKDHDDYTPLMRLVVYHRPNVVVELGTAHGNTVANICRQLPETTVYTVNAPLQEQSGEIVTYKLTKDEIGRVYRDAGVGSRVIQIFKNTLQLDLSEHLRGRVVDFAIIDACHDTDYVLNDFHKVEPFVRPSGLVVFHDTHPSMADHLAGSYMACMQLRRQGYDIKHIRNTWWAIWAKPTDDGVVNATSQRATARTTQPTI